MDVPMNFKAKEKLKKAYLFSKDLLYAIWIVLVHLMLVNKTLYFGQLNCPM